MDVVKIYKNKILFYKNAQKRAQSNLSNIPGAIIEKLIVNTQIADDVTLGHLFKLLIKEQVWLEKIYSPFLTESSLKVLIHEFNTQKKMPDDERIDFIEFYWLISADEEEFEMRPEIRGKRRQNGANNDEDEVTLDYIPISVLKNCKLILNKNIAIRRVQSMGEAPVLVSNKNFTLSDIIQAIFYQFSFYGYHSAGAASKNRKTKKS